MYMYNMYVCYMWCTYITYIICIHTVCMCTYIYIYLFIHNIIHEAQHQVMVVGKVIFLLVSPHTEIMGVTQNNFYQLHYRMNE